MVTTDALGAERAGGLVAGERLLGVARVARAQHHRVGRRPRRQPVGARDEDRPRGVVAERRARERAADRRAAHARRRRARRGCPSSCMIADSTRHSASRRCSGSASTSSSWPEGSTRAIASRESVPSPPPRGVSAAWTRPWCPGAAWRRVGRACSSELDRAVGQGDTREDTRPAGDHVVRPHGHALAEHRAAVDRLPSPTRQPAATMQSRSVQPAPISRAARGRPSARPCVPAPTRTSAPSTTRLPTCAPGATCTPRSITRRRDRRGPATARRRSTASQPLAQPRPHGRLDVALDDVERALQVALGRADVEPVAVRREAVQPVADQQRPDLALDRDVALRAGPARGSRARARRRRR